MMLRISTGESRYQKVWHTTETTWGNLVERLSATRRTDETVAEYAAMTKTRQAAVKDVGGFVGGVLEEGRRGRGRVQARSLLTLDLDHGDEDTEGMLEILLDNEAVIYATHKHTPKSPRLRLVLPLSREVSEEEYEPLARKVAESLGMETFDDTTYEAHRLMYWPSTPSDGDYFYRHVEGDVLDPDKVLAEYEDWRDITSWPTSLRQEKALVAPRGAAADPTTKDGLIGAFCRVYDIHDAIEKFLPEIYAPTGTEDRYDYVPGESSSGVVTYDGLFSYSHHSTDPAGGQLVNAFDLVRLHRFGKLDEDAKVDTPFTRLPSYTAMQDLARSDETVRGTLTAERQALAEAEFAVIDPDWEQRLTLDRKGKVEGTLPNLVMILENDPAFQSLAWDELWQAIAVREPSQLPWCNPHGFWRDPDDAQLAVYVEQRYGRFTQRDLLTALSAVTDDRRFHPVIDYLESLPVWDGVKRVDSLLVDYLGAEDCDYTRAVTRKLLCAAVRRVKRPGCKFDTMLVLAGPQGVGKSTLVARLGGKWFNDSLSLTDTRDKTAAEKLQGFWIQEFGELSGMRKAEVESMRAFISRQDDVYRGSYDRRVSRHPRQAVFIGTTNAENGFLTDPAGNRRFWPVNTPGGSKDKPWNITQDTINQIWAETLTLEPDERLYLEGALAEEAAERQRAAIEVDERAGVVKEYLERLLPEGWDDYSTADRYAYLTGGDFGTGPTDGHIERSQVSVVEVWCECFGKAKADLNRRESYAISNMLRSLGWESDRRSVRVRPYGKQMVFKPSRRVESA